MKGTNYYPKNWPDIAKKIKDSVGWICENCDHPHDPVNGYTLTVHHLNGDKADCRYENLLACCQRCHLRIQATYYPGQLLLVDPPQWMVKRGLHASL